MPAQQCVQNEPVQCCDQLRCIGRGHAAFDQDLGVMAERWWRDPQYSHGFLVPGFAALILWFRRPFLAGAVIKTSWWGLAFLGVGLALRLAGGVMDVESVDGFSLLPTLAGLVLLLGGRQIFAWSWPAIAFLAFMLPMPFAFETALGRPLRYMATVASTYVLQTIGFPALASTSMEQARVAMVHAFDLKYKTQLTHILPYGIYTIPECSMAGETEESLQQKKIPYVVGKTHYGSNARGQIIGGKEGFLKLLFREDDMKLLGVHMIGEQASEVIHIGLTAMQTNADADLFIQTCYNYPTLSEMYKYATYDALGRRAFKQKAKSERKSD